MNNKSVEMSVFINPVGSYHISMGYGFNTIDMIL